MEWYRPCFAATIILMMLLNAHPAWADERAEKLKGKLGGLFKQLQDQQNTTPPTEPKEVAPVHEDAPRQSIAVTTSSSEKPGAAKGNERVPEINELRGMELVRTSRIGQFEIHGVHLGMTITDAASMLEKSGWNIGPREQGIIALKQSDTVALRIAATPQLSDPDVSLLVHRIEYEQRYEKSGQFDANLIASQVISKYGPPSHDSRMAAPGVSSGVLAVSMQYFDEVEVLEVSPNRLVGVCMNEMMSKGTSRFEANRDAMLIIDRYKWVQTLGENVREKCPGTYPEYIFYMKALLLPQMTVNIESRSTTIRLSSESIRNEPDIRMRLKGKEQFDSIPAPKIDL